MAHILVKHLKELKQLNWQRKAWLVLSAGVLIVIGLLIFDKNWLQHLGLYLPTAMAGIALSVVWWYWAMHMMGRLLSHRKEETEVLMDIHDSIKEIREEVRKSFPN
jgi:hypothetical protein